MKTFRRLHMYPLVAAVMVPLLFTGLQTPRAEQAAQQDLADTYAKRIRPLVQKYCLECHSKKVHKGDLDLERFDTVDTVRKDVHPWQQLIEQIEVGEMPPKGKPRPSAEERLALLGWTREMLAVEARARAGDPGKVVLRRLNNAEFTNTIRDLTGVELRPAREFPADSAAGEGFANTGETLNMSPTLIDRYLKSAKDVAAHLVLVPDGLRFSASTSRRDWATEVVEQIRHVYAPYGKNGPRSPERHWATLLVHRDDIAAGRLKISDLAEKEKLSLAYLSQIWNVIMDEKASFLLEHFGKRWRQADKNAAADIAAEIAALQKEMWKPGARVAYYTRYLEPQMPKATSELTTKLDVIKGQDEVVLYLTAEALTKDKEPGHLVWQNPRLVLGKQPPILLRDVAALAPRLIAKRKAALANTDKYLEMTVALRDDPSLDVKALAKQAGLDADILQRWAGYLALPVLAAKPLDKPLAHVKEPALPFKLLTQKSPTQKTHVSAWAHSSNDRLPSVVSNSSDMDERIPGFLPAHKVAMHPTPSQFVGVVWTSPLAGAVDVAAQISHAHPSCGNGVVWWLEHRRGNQAEKRGKGALDLGTAITAKVAMLQVEKGDAILLAVGPRDRSHICDLTGVDLTIQSADNRRWDLAQDVANTLLESNPHADRQGNKETWQFVFGDDPDLKFPPPKGKATTVKVPPGSVLAEWRDAASDPKRQAQLPELGRKVHALLTQAQPAKTKADQEVQATLSAMTGPLFQGIDFTSLLAPSESTAIDARFGIDPARFGKHPSGKSIDPAHLVVPVPSVLEVRLPAALALGRQFTAEVLLGPGDNATTMARASVRTTKDPKVPGSSTWLFPATVAGKEKMERAVADFQEMFPAALFYPDIVPVEGDKITLRLFYREDDALGRLMLDAEQKRHLDRLWSELRFISQDALRIHESFDLFIGFASQVGLVPEFEPHREPIRKRAEAFQKEMLDAEPKHLAALTDFAARAYRRPLLDDEKQKLSSLYKTLRQKDASHEDAIKAVLTRVLVSPHFLYRLENPPPGAKAGPVTDLELATRLSYFLWASMPDAELADLAAAGRLRETKVLLAQAERMRKASRIRGLATEFGMQWLQVRDIDEHKEKSEKLFPTFDDKLRQAFFEESTLLFQDLFQNDRSVLDLLQGDYAFVNETLAKHYGVPGVKGQEWRKLDGAGKFGRGGILTLASVLTKQAGASRTSPILRGNWVADILLGEKLPRPPANVPQLPEAEDTSKLTVRQLVELHTKDPLCANCHRRIDPLGFALENYDPIGRYRLKDLGGRPVETKVELHNGAKFDGVDGLRRYLSQDRREDFLRTFCRKLLGYSLGRPLALSDHPLVDEMLESLRKNDHRVSAAILPIVRSTQFRYIRGLETAKEP